MGQDVFFYLSLWGRGRLEIVPSQQVTIEPVPLWSHSWLTGKCNYDRGKSIIHTTCKKPTRVTEWGKVLKKDEEDRGRKKVKLYWRRRGGGGGGGGGVVLRWTGSKGEKTAETNNKSSIIRAGKLAHTHPKTQTECAACWEPDIRDWGSGEGSNVVVIPSCTLGMSSLVFEAFPHKRESSIRERLEENRKH